MHSPLSGKHPAKGTLQGQPLLLVVFLAEELALFKFFFLAPSFS